MANDEIVAGLKNALERGSSIEKAVQSFINAGYNPVEVRAAADILTQGPSSITSSPTKLNLLPKIESIKKAIPPKVQASESNQLHSPTQQLQQQQIQKPRSGKIKILIIILVVLLLFILGSIFTAMFFGDQILEVFFG